MTFTDTFGRRLPDLRAANSIQRLFADTPTPNVAWLENIDPRKLSKAVADMRAENEASSRNASRAFDNGVNS